MSATIKKTRLIIADDHAVLRLGLQHIFLAIEEFELVASVSDGGQLISAVRQHEPDIVITDLQMPKISGRDACMTILKEFPNIGIIAYSMHDSEELILSMRQIGVRGYLVKGDNSEDLCQAVRVVYAGGEFYSKCIQHRMLQLFKVGKLAPSLTQKKSNFSKTELDIIQLICSEYSTKEIADKLKIKERTIQFHKENIEQKMDVRSVFGIAVYATTNWLLY